MKKFDLWNDQKKQIDGNKEIPFCHTREIWFVRLGENVGYEQDGKGTEFLRPIAIIKKFNKNLLWAIPLTSQEKKGRYYYPVRDFNNRSNTAILSQIRLIDTKRLRYKIGILEKHEFIEIKKAISEILLSNDDF